MQFFSQKAIQQSLTIYLIHQFNFYKQNMAQLQNSLQTLRQTLVPNFVNLHPVVQDQISLILYHLSEAPSKQAYQQYSRSGLLEETPLLRAQIWKVLLGIMKQDPNTWHEKRQENCQLYQCLTDYFFPEFIDDDNLFDDKIDKELWKQITLDTRRTHSVMHFFQAESHKNKIYKSKETKHFDILSKILYIWGKINPAVRYVQGMNEILAPIYYLEFQSAENVQWNGEAEVFFLFSAIMSFLIDMHSKEIDDSQNGIMGRILTLNKFLKIVDFQLWKKLQEQKIVPQYYSFRWLTLMLSQDFSLYDTMKLWDCILAIDDENRFKYLYSLCIAIIKLQKKIIMKSDHLTILQLMKKLKGENVERIIKIGEKVFERYVDVNIQKEYKKIEKKQNFSKEQEWFKKFTKTFWKQQF